MKKKKKRKGRGGEGRGKEMEREKEKEKEKEKEEIEGRGEICHEPFQACNGAPFNWKEGRKEGRKVWEGGRQPAERGRPPGTGL